MLEMIKEQILGKLSMIWGMAKKRLLGSNNERLDFVMDSFYKLSPNAQNFALIGVASSVALIVILIFSVYFSQIRVLERELSEGFDAMRQIRTLSSDYNAEKERMDNLMRIIDTKTNTLKPKPFLEEKANQIGVALEGLRSEEIDMPPDSPLAPYFMAVNVDFRIPKVSIPRMLKFFEEIEKSDKGLNVRNLQIRARYGDKLYFDVQARVTGLKAKTRG